MGHGNVYKPKVTKHVLAQKLIGRTVAESLWKLLLEEKVSYKTVSYNYDISIQIMLVQNVNKRFFNWNKVIKNIDFNISFKWY